MIPRLIRKFFSGITEEPDTPKWVNPYQQLFIACQLRRSQTLEAGMKTEEPDTDEWNNPWGQPLWDGKSSPYTDAELDVIRGLGKASD